MGNVLIFIVGSGRHIWDKEFFTTVILWLLHSMCFLNSWMERNKDGVCCMGYCARTFHAKCIGMSTKKSTRRSIFYT